MGFPMRTLLSLLLFSLLTACGGGGGGAPSNVAVSQPAPCVVASSITPQSYLGSYSTPTPADKLDNAIQRSMGLKDYYPGNACNYIKTLDRLQTLGVDRVWVYQYGVWDDFNKPVWSVNKSDWQIPESAFTQLVIEAKKRNIKVFVAWQFTALDSRNNLLPLGSDIPVATVERMLNSHHRNMIEFAKYCESIGVAGISVDWNAFYIPNFNDVSGMWASSMIATAKDIRANFSGVLTYGQSSILFDGGIFNEIDELHVSLVPKLTLAENSNLSVPLLKTKFTELIDFEFARLNTTKPVIWEIAVQSRDLYFIEGWIEDGFCVNSCIQNSYVTDFSIQAIGVEAALQAIHAQNKFVTKSVNFHTSYWHTETVTAGPEGFPNLSQSIRGKPAENIVKHWFSKG